MRGWQDRLNDYDPDEPLVVPYWAVLAARGLAGTLGRALKKSTLNLSDREIEFIARATLAAEPRPGEPTPVDRERFADFLTELGDTLRRCLPSP